MNSNNRASKGAISSYSSTFAWCPETQFTAMDGNTRPIDVEKDYTISPSLSVNSENKIAKPDIFMQMVLTQSPRRSTPRSHSIRQRRPPNVSAGQPNRCTVRRIDLSSDLESSSDEPFSLSLTLCAVRAVFCGTKLSCRFSGAKLRDGTNVARGRIKFGDSM